MMFKTRRTSGSLHRVIDEVLVLLIGLLVVYKIPDSGRRMAVIRKISPTSNMIGYWCFTSNERYPLAALLFSSNLNPCVALRDKFWRVTIGLLFFSKLYPYTRTSLSMADDSTSDVLSVSSEFYKKLKNVSCEYDRVNGLNSTLQAARYIRHVVLCLLVHVATCQFSVSGIWWLFTKVVQDLLFWHQFWPTSFSSAKYQPGTIKMEECPTKPSELRLPFFIGGPLHACCRSKNLHTPVWLYCATISFSAVL